MRCFKGIYIHHADQVLSVLFGVGLVRYFVLANKASASVADFNRSFPFGINGI